MLLPLPRGPSTGHVPGQYRHRTLVSKRWTKSFAPGQKKSYDCESFSEEQLLGRRRPDDAIELRGSQGLRGFRGSGVEGPTPHTPHPTSHNPPSNHPTREAIKAKCPDRCLDKELRATCWGKKLSGKTLGSLTR